MEVAKSNILNIADLCPATYALGPGLRSAIWVQGCPIHCKGCIAPDWIPFKPAHLLTPQEAGDRLITNPNIEGITISGGEPMIQAAGLAEMVRYIRTIKAVNVICFTGFRYESLLNWEKEKEIINFLAQIDVLIDGPYIENQNNGLTFAGSTNQRMIELTQNILPGPRSWHKRKMEIHIRNRNILSVGIPPRNWIRDPIKIIPEGFVMNAERQNERL